MTSWLLAFLHLFSHLKNWFLKSSMTKEIVFRWSVPINSGSTCKFVYKTFSDDWIWKVFSILKCYEVCKNIIRMFLSISNCFVLMKNEFHIFFCIPKESHGITAWEETRRFKVASGCKLTEWNATYHVFIYHLFMCCLPCLEHQNFSSTPKFMWEKSWTISRLGNF